MLETEIPQWSVNLLTFIVITIGFYLVGKILVKPVTRKILSKKSRAMANLFSKIALYLTIIVGLAAGLTAGGYEGVLTSLGAVIAGGTVAIGFAMKDSINSVVSGIFIIMDEPFEIGDWIEWNGNQGIVEDIGLRTTTVQTFNKEKLTVPNDELANNTVKNPVDGKNVRVTLDIGIGYDSDMDKAKKIVKEILDDSDMIAEDPAPDVKLVSLGDSSIDFKARYWIDHPKRADFVKTREKVLKKVKERFDSEGIDIPYPTRTIAGDELNLKES